MRSVDFVKMVGSGNDFILIDTQHSQFAIPNNRLPNFVKEICQRKQSIGADGVLLLEDSEKYDIKMRIFNPDGSEVEMCGNGARCIALWAKSKIKNHPSTKFISSEVERLGTRKSKIIIVETRAGILEAEIAARDRVKLKMPDPKDIRLNCKLQVADGKLDAHFINTGVPHVVYFVEDLESIDVKRLGRAIRYHEEFQPQGTNVDFVKVIDDKNLKIRTYERGVEDETLACGTGAVAGSLIAYRLSLIGQNRINVHTKGGEILKVYFDSKGDKFNNLWLEGEARVVYEGRYSYV